MLTYVYDKEADVFYFSQGKPDAKDETIEAGDDVLLRVHSRTKKIHGFTILNASKRVSIKSKTILPFRLESLATK